MPIGLPCPARFLHFCRLTDGHPIQQCAAYVDSAAPRRRVSFRPWTYPRQHGSGRDLAHSPQTHQLLGTEVASVEIPLAVVTKKSEHIDREYSIPFQLGPDHDVGNDLSSG